MTNGLFTELRRRNVFRVAAAYMAIAWLVLQVIDTLAGFIDFPDWIGTYALIGVVAGFPIAVLLAWAYELTPDLPRASADAPAAGREVSFGGRKLDFVIIGALALVVVLLVVSERIAPPARDSRELPVVSRYTQLTQSRFVVPPMPSPYPIVPDASRIYFNDFDLGRLGMRQVSQQGGEAIRFDTSAAGPLAEFHPLALTPDRSSLAMNRIGLDAPFPFELWLFPLVGGTPRMLGQAGDATFSPDGTKIAYESALGTISVADADLSGPRELVKTPGRVHWIRFSPDGKRLRYTAYKFNVPFAMFPHVALQAAIWEIDVDGGEPVPLFPDWEQIGHCCGVWTPDGKYFVFQAIHDNRTQLWAVNETVDEQPVQITESALEFRRPAISPDGMNVFAISWQLRGEVARYDQRVQSFVPMKGFESVSADQLGFSTDGLRVAYVTYPAGNLWLSNRDGSEPRQLTFAPMRAAAPAWSQDGETIAFVGSSPDGSIGIYSVPAQRGPARPIGDTTVAQAFPGWTAEPSGIVYMQANKERLLRFDIVSGESNELPGTEGLTAPRLSSNGRMIAARSAEGLVIMDLETGSRRVVVNDWSKLQWFYWGAGDEHVFLVDVFAKGNERTIWRLDLESGDLDALVVIGNTPTAWSDVGMWVGIDPDGAPIVLKDTSIHHVYALEWLH